MNLSELRKLLDPVTEGRIRSLWEDALKSGTVLTAGPEVDVIEARDRELQLYLNQLGDA